MKSKPITTLAFATVAGAASAQLTGFHLSAGYGFSGGITDTGGVSRTMSGPELMGSFSINHLPMVDIGVEADILFGGGFGNSSIKGNIFRGLLTARFSIPGSQMSAWVGAGFGTAQGSSGDFASVSGAVTQFGVSLPLGGKMPAFAPMLEIAADLGSKTAISGLTFSVGLKF